MPETVRTKEDVKRVLRKNITQLRNLGVARIGLFGSFVRGEQDEKSDVDVLVEFEDGQKTYDHFIELAYLLEGILQRKVEIVTFESLSPYIGPYILKEVEYVPIAA